MDVTATQIENALALIASIDEALARGVEHYDKDGRPLTTRLEILEALKRDGEIVLKPPPDAR